MTQIAFNPTTTQQSVDWDDDKIWLPEQVPDSVGDNVLLPVILSGGDDYTYYISILTGENYSVGSLDMAANYLLLNGTLSVAGDLNEQKGSEIDADDATLNAGSLEVSGYDIQGSGTIAVSGALTVTGEIVGDFTVTAGTLALPGELLADNGVLSVTAGASGLLQGDELISGTYATASASSTLSMNIGAAPTELGVEISLAKGGAIDFYDPTAKQYRPIQDTLTTIAHGGVLQFGGAATQQFGALDDAGLITLEGVTFDPTGLTIAADGELDGNGTLAGAVVNDGVIDGYIVVDQEVTGSGHFEIDAGTQFSGGFLGGFADTIEFTGSQFQNVVFVEDAGTLTLDDPSDYTGVIVAGAPASADSTSFNVDLTGVDDSAVTSWSYNYSGDQGTLVIDTTDGNYSLRFQGELTRGDFTLSAGYRQLSTLPPVLDIAVAPQFSVAETQTPLDLNGDGISDVVWRDTNGDVTVWNMASDGVSYQSQDLGYVSSDWTIAGVGDFNGEAGDGILWRNANGDVTTWNSTRPESFGDDGGETYYVSTDWQVAGVGDFNGDGLSDILWRNANGDVDVWTATPGSSPTAFSADPLLYVSTDWTIAGVGDFNGSGADGVLWRNSVSGDVTVWNNVNGAFVAADLGDVSSDWSIAGVGDFTDAKAGDDSILWRNGATGDVALWTVNSGGTSTVSHDLGYVSDNWIIQSVGDFNGDGYADILWRNETSGDVTVWLNNAGDYTFTAKDLGGVSGDWSVASK